VDIERIAAGEAGFVQTLTTVHERNMIQNFPAAERHVWITRLWCAKEAVGKLLGTGIDGAPQALEAIQMENGGQIQIRHRASARVIHVTTVENLGFIIAYANSPQGALAREVSQAVVYAARLVFEGTTCDGPHFPTTSASLYEYIGGSNHVRTVTRCFRHGIGVEEGDS